MPNISAIEILSIMMNAFGDILIFLALVCALLAAVTALLRGRRGFHAGAMAAGIGATTLSFAGIFARRATSDPFPIGLAWHPSNLVAFTLTALAALILLAAIVLILILPSRR